MLSCSLAPPPPHRRQQLPWLASCLSPVLLTSLGSTWIIPPARWGGFRAHLICFLTFITWWWEVMASCILPFFSYASPCYSILSGNGHSCMCFPACRSFAGEVGLGQVLSLLDTSTVFSVSEWTSERNGFALGGNEMKPDPHSFTRLSTFYSKTELERVKGFVSLI